MSYSMQLTKILAYSFDEHWWPKQTQLLKRSLYLMCFIYCIYYLFDFAELFGPDAYIIRQPKGFSGLRDFAFLLNSHPEQARYYLLLAAGIALMGLLGRRHVVTDAVLWLLFVNLHYALYAGITGGHYLLNQLLFFQCLLNFPEKKSENIQLQNFSNNLGACLIMVQVCLLYLVSAVAKLQSEKWMQGSALAAVSGLRHFRWNESRLIPEGWLSRVLTYAVLIYQLFFPMLIWLPKFKKTLLIAGVLIYLYIALYMGLVSFGITMIVAHLYFWPIKPVKS